MSVNIKLSINNLVKKIAGNDLAILSRIIKGASWILIGTIFSKLMLLLSSIIVARILGKETFGEVGILRSTINSFSMMANMGLGITATKFIAENLHKRMKSVGEVIGFTISLAVIFALVVFILFITFSNEISIIIASEHLEDEVIVSAFILLFVTINSAQIGVLSGFEKFSVIAKTTLIGAFFSFIFQILGAYYFGVKGTLIGFGINYFILFVLFNRNIFLISKKLKIKITFKKISKYKSLFIKISLPAALSGILVSPIFWLCNTILVNQKNGYGNMAILDAASQWQQIILFIPSALSQLLLPLLASYSDDQNSFKKVFKYNLLINLAIVFILCIVILFTSNFIMGFYGESFKSGSLVLILMSIASLPMVVSSLIGQSLIAKEKVWIGLLFNLVWGACFISLSYNFIDSYQLGVLGYAYSFLISYIIHMMLNLGYVKVFKN